MVPVRREGTRRLNRWRRLGLVLLGTLVPLLLIEGALQIGAAFYGRGRLTTRGVELDPLAIRLLAVGDSNTFGVRVAAEDAWPGQLEALLNRGGGGVRYQVINRGVPGQNTAQILALIADDIEETDPDILLVLAGINNAWNVASRRGGADEKSWLDHSRLVRLIRIARHDASVGERDDERRNRGATVPDVAEVVRLEAARSDAELLALTRDELMSIVAAATAAGVKTALLNYPGHHPAMGPFNEAPRAAAQSAGLLIDLDLAFDGYIGRYGYDALMFEDSHPAEAGYELVAREVLRALIAAEWVDGVSPPAHGPPRELRAPARMTVEHDESGRPVALRLEAEPDAGFQIYVSPVTEPPLRLGSRTIGIGVHEWIEFCRGHEPFRGELDAAGAAYVALPETIRALPPESRLYAAFVTSDPHALHDISLRSVSEVVEIVRR